MKQGFLKTEKEIIEWLDKYNIKNYTLIADEKYGFVVNVDSSVDLNNNYLDYIPVKFNNIKDGFYCSFNELTSLVFCPNNVGSHFNCSNNKLVSLEYCAETINGTFNCSNNEIISLEFCPKIVGGNFLCYSNKIENYIYFPEKISGDIVLNYGEKYNFAQSSKIHLKDKAEYEKKLLNKSLKILNIVDKNNNSFKI